MTDVGGCRVPRRGRRRARAGWFLLLGCAAFGLLACRAPSFAGDGSLPLVWHVESDDGRTLDDHDGGRLVNPASVVKLATTLRALDTLGTEHRFVTSFGISGEAQPVRGVVHGSLVVDGGADPDFHFENAMVVAHALEEAGITRVDGDLFVGSTFWIGWERGTVGREPDPVKRRLDMGRRLVEAWSPAAWGGDERKAWAELASRRGWKASNPPVIAIDGRVRIDEAPHWRSVVVHRSEPLLVALRRFNVYSNNDIERLDASIGSPAQLSAFLQKRLGRDAAVTSFATSSGLNGNRMTPRLVVGLLKDLRSWLAAHGHRPGDVMPVLGCGVSTLSELFLHLVSSHEADGMIGKTGTLNTQDGGVSALAGFLPVGPGLVFFVAAPGAGAELWKARGEEEAWVKSVLLRYGAVGAVTCPEPVPTSEAFAEIDNPNLVSRR